MRPANKQLAEAFRGCLSYLEPHGVRSATLCSTICGALSMWSESKGSSQAWVTASWAQSIIQTRLQGHMTLTSWLHVKHNVPDADLTPSNRQAHRVAWVHRLIKEFES